MQVTTQKIVWLGTCASVLLHICLSCMSYFTICLSVPHLFTVIVVCDACPQQIATIFSGKIVHLAYTLTCTLRVGGGFGGVCTLHVCMNLCMCGRDKYC